MISTYQKPASHRVEPTQNSQQWSPSDPISCGEQAREPQVRPEEDLNQGAAVLRPWFNIPLSPFPL